MTDKLFLIMEKYLPNLTDKDRQDLLRECQLLTATERSVSTLTSGYGMTNALSLTTEQTHVDRLSIGPYLESDPNFKLAVFEGAGKIQKTDDPVGGQLLLQSTNTYPKNDDVGGLVRFMVRDSSGADIIAADIYGQATDVTHDHLDGSVKIVTQKDGADSFVFNLVEDKCGILATTPTAVLDVASDIIRLRTAKTPASAAAAGNAGDICWDASYIYVCTATNTWKRVAIATW